MADDETIDLWSTIDFPVLRWLGQLIDVDGAGEVRSPDVAMALGLEANTVRRSFVRLWDAEYVTGANNSDLNGRSIIVEGLTEKARRAVGLWPNTLHLEEAFLELVQKAEETEPDPVKKSRWRELGKTVRNIGEGGLGSVLAAIVTKGSM